MSEAYKCDNCERFYEGEPIFWSFSTKSGSYRNNLDLCSDCNNKLEDILNQFDNNDS